MANTVQFRPVDISFVTEDGRRSVVVSTVVDIEARSVYKSRERGPNNL
jgi:hypothetical protein